MSWSLNVAKVAKADFDAAVDATEASGQPPETPGLAEDVAAAKATLKSLAPRVKQDFIIASASGHCWSPREEGWHDGISVSVSGSSVSS